MERSFSINARTAESGKPALSSDHRWHRYSTKHLNLEYAKESASALYDEIRFKEKLGISHSSRKFSHVAKDCIAELEQKIAAGICPMTNHDYIRAITLYLVPFFGNYQLENITAPVVAQYEAWRNLKMKRIPMSSTLMTHASAYNKVIQHAVLKGWLNPLLYRPLLAESRTTTVT